MTRLLILALALLSTLGVAAVAQATHHPQGCKVCASHKYWPTVDGVLKMARGVTANYTGTEKSDELLGHHGSDTLSAGEGIDIIWGDWDPNDQPPGQYDVIYGGGGTDFIYGSHGFNRIYGGEGNDAISVHYGRGVVDCGPGRDIYHVAKKRRKGYTFKNCEKVDYRPEKVRGGGLKPLK